MREILFRAKRADTDEWVEGYYCPCVFGRFPADPAIIYPVLEKRLIWTVRVRENTLCEYTGLKDKNGRKIFEGDILEGEITGIRGFVEYNFAQAGYYVRSFVTNIQYLLIEDTWRRIGTIYKKLKRRQNEHNILYRRMPLQGLHGATNEVSRQLRKIRSVEKDFRPSGGL